jgi:hypothetical protein
MRIYIACPKNTLEVFNMSKPESKKVIFAGKFSDVSLLLKKYEKKYTYLYELIDALNSEKNTKLNLN